VADQEAARLAAHGIPDAQLKRRLEPPRVW